MSTKQILLVMFVALSLILIPPYGCAVPTAQENQLKTVTLQIKQAVQSELDHLDLDMSAAASQLSRTGLSGTEARHILDGLASKYPFVIDYATADTAGIMVTVAPDAFSHYQGNYIGTENVTAPVLTPMFTAVEGVDAVALMWPVVSDNGSSIGIISALFKPQKLFATTVASVLKGTGISLNVMQLDGLNIYDSGGLDTGKNLFTDPEFKPYSELIALGHRMVAEESGYGSYTFIDHPTGKTMKKMAYWATAGLHDTEWLLASVENVSQ